MGTQQHVIVAMPWIDSVFIHYHFMKVVC